MNDFNAHDSDLLLGIISRYINEVFILKVKKPAVRLKATRGKTGAKDTKFGGKPFIPKGFHYPRKNGDPLVLIAQINFAEIPHLDGYPESGLLQIYLEYDETAMFDPESYKIVYHKDISGKNCYRNPFSSVKKTSSSGFGYTDYFAGVFEKTNFELSGRLASLMNQAGLLMMVDAVRYQVLFDELAASYTEYRPLDEAKLFPISIKDNAFIKIFRECTDYIQQNPNEPDAKIIAEIIENAYFKTTKGSSFEFSEDILPLNPDRSYKIETELFDMHITPDVKGFNTLLFEKFSEYVGSNKEFICSDSERKIVGEFIEKIKSTPESDLESTLFEIFTFDKYYEITKPLYATELADYDKFGACLIGGYPRFEQGDYRPECYSETLLQIDSFDYADGYENTVMWGDGGVINFFMKPEDLRNADFSDVNISGDCG
jgi:uncharacterized protein YwqG